MLIKDVVCLVTGGASGLGLATAKRLLNQGAKVVIVDVVSSEGETIAKELGTNCTFVQADVSIVSLYIALLFQEYKYKYLFASVVFCSSCE
jgi:NAD(P)-dependent dehydrogenase (short-subunit alcohol dehydrogenase family)